MGRGNQRLTPKGRVSLSRELIGFALAGGLAFGVDLATFNILIFQKVNVSVASVSAAIPALLVNYTINHRTFLSQQSMTKNFATKSVRFVAIAAASALYLLIGFEIAIRLLPDQSATTYSLVRMFLIGSGALLRFAFFKLWVFENKNM